MLIEVTKFNLLDSSTASLSTRSQARCPRNRSKVPIWTGSAKHTVEEDISDSPKRLSLMPADAGRHELRIPRYPIPTSSGGFNGLSGRVLVLNYGIWSDHEWPTALSRYRLRAVFFLTAALPKEAFSARLCGLARGSLLRSYHGSGSCEAG
jgi:hypothetical protein